MREVSLSRLAMLSILLLATALLIHGTFGVTAAMRSKEPLHQVFARIKGLKLATDFPLETRLVNMLDLDDYLFQAYGRDNGLVTLYIGYYRTAKKVGAAHDPLVCFQGQGWQISSRDRGEFVVNHDPLLKISYSSMIAERQEEHELIVYWFQANRKATANTYSQKAYLVSDKLFGRNGDNAFVRISTPLGTDTLSAARKRVFDFIGDFYPDFYRYVTKTT